MLTSAEEDLNNHVDRMNRSVDTSSTSFPSYADIAHGGRDGDYALAEQDGLPLTKADLATVSAVCPICQQPTLNSQFGTIPEGDQPATWQQFDCTELLASQKGQCFVPTAVNTLKTDLLFLHTIASAKTTIRGFTEYLAHSCGSTASCYKLNCFPAHRSPLLLTPHVTVFGDRALQEITKVI